LNCGVTTIKLLGYLATAARKCHLHAVFEYSNLSNFLAGLHLFLTFTTDCFIKQGRQLYFCPYNYHVSKMGQLYKEFTSFLYYKYKYCVVHRALYIFILRNFGERRIEGWVTLSDV
jgi:hypothetical protein